LPTDANYLVEIIDLLVKSQINSLINIIGAQINTSMLSNGIYLLKLKIIMVLLCWPINSQ